MPKTLMNVSQDVELMRDNDTYCVTYKGDVKLVLKSISDMMDRITQTCLETLVVSSLDSDRKR